MEISKKFHKWKKVWIKSVHFIQILFSSRLNDCDGKFSFNRKKIQFPNEWISNSHFIHQKGSKSFFWQQNDIRLSELSWCIHTISNLPWIFIYLLKTMLMCLRWGTIKKKNSVRKKIQSICLCLWVVLNTDTSVSGENGIIVLHCIFSLTFHSFFCFHLFLFKFLSVNVEFGISSKYSVFAQFKAFVFYSLCINVIIKMKLFSDIQISF